MIELTEAAALEIQRIVEEKALPDSTALRLAIKGGGCAGFNYVLDFAVDKKQFDEEFVSQGRRVLVDRKSLLYVDGTVIDFDTSLMERGFKFHNPLADAACGCGTSFTPVKKTLA